MKSRHLASTALLLASIACGPPPAPKPTEPAPAPTALATASADVAAEPPAVPIAPLRTGGLDEVVSKLVVNGKVAERGMVGGAEVMRVELTDASQEALTNLSIDGYGGFEGADWVSLAGETGLVGVLVNETPTNFADGWVPGPNGTLQRARRHDVLWLRRSNTKGSGPIEARLHVASRRSDLPGYVLPVSIEPGGSAAAKPKLAARWGEAVGRYLGRRYGSPLSRLAVERLVPKATKPAPSSDDFTDGTETAMEWGYLMDLTTGATSVRAALQEGARLRSEVDRFRPTLPFSSVQGPTLRKHPWKLMLKALGRSAPAEPLAAAAPADFYYVRAEDVGALMALIDEVDAWGTPLVHLLEGRTEHHHLSRRYRLALGLPGSELSKVMGPKVIRRLALVGSDPFLRQGSDLTLIVEPKSGALLRAGFERELRQALAGRGEPQRETVDHQGVAISIVRSADGAVRQHRAQHKGFELVSTSLNALKRVLDTIAGRGPALSAELDFQYMLARDADVAHEVLLYAGDRFIDRAISPRSRILDARRQVAAAELERPAQAALLYGWLHGEAPADTAALRASKLLVGKDLRHFDGSNITFAPGQAPRSAWGQPGAMTALLDRPDPKRITKVEQDAYRAFVRSYEALWSEAIDPIALRVGLDGGETPKGLRARLRVLPLVQNADYRTLTGLVGDGRLAPGRVRHGVRLLLAIAEDSELRRELTQSSGALLGQELRLDWVGDYAMIGVLDRPELANALHQAGIAPELPDPKDDHDEIEALVKVPLYAAVAVKNRKAAALVITMLRTKLADLSAFKKHGDHRDTTIMRAEIDRDLSLYYALSDHAVYVALQPWVIEQLLDEEARGDLPKKADSTKGASQATFEVRAKRDGGLVTALHWLFASESEIVGSRGAAEMLLVGAPSSRGDAARYEALALAYLGAVPLTVDAKPFALWPSGAADPARGNDHVRRWPALPVAGSPAQRVLDALELFRADIAFDPEPTAPSAREERSLSVGVTVGRR